MALFSLMAKLGLDIADFQSGIKRSQSLASGLAKDASSAAAGMAKGWLAAAFGAGAIAANLKNAADRAGELADASARLGVLPKTLQQFNAAALLAGANLEAVTAFFEKLAVAREEALSGSQQGGKLKDAFAIFGVDTTMLQSAKLDDIAKKIARAFESGNQQALIGSLRELGGKGAGALIPAFTDGIDEAAESAKNLGLILEDDVIANLDDFGDRITTLTERVNAFFSNMASASIDGIRTMMAYLNAGKESLHSFFMSPLRDKTNPEDLPVSEWMGERGKEAATTAYRISRARGEGLMASAASAVSAWWKTNKDEALAFETPLPISNAQKAFRNALSRELEMIRLDREERLKKFNEKRTSASPENLQFQTGEDFGPLEAGQTWEMFAQGKRPRSKERIKRERERFELPKTGSLASIGGLYFGADYNTRLMSTAEKQVRELEKISTNTKDTAERLAE